MRAFVVLALALLTPPKAHALDAEVAAALAPPSGAEVTHEETRDLDSYALPIGMVGGPGPLTIEVEGSVRWTAWRLRGAEGTLALTRVFRDRLTPLGFETTLFCVGPRCGGYDFRYALTVLPQPAMVVNLADFRQLTMTRVEPDARLTVVSLLASRLGGVTHLQLVAVEGAERADAAPTGPRPSPQVAVSVSDAAPAAVAAASRDSSGEPSTPSDIIAQVLTKGSAPLDGVDFVAGSSTVAPHAGPILDRVAEALRQADGLSVVIVGHTDASGALKPNMQVSEARARAVRDALIARGVPAGRLDAAGAGWLAPRASNATEEGRALNRRVELVAR